MRMKLPVAECWVNGTSLDGFDGSITEANGRFGEN
jgi:hypothetical protein